MRSKRARNRDGRDKKDERNSIQCYLLRSISFDGPQHASTGPYASVSILEPLITIERHHGKYHIAARFNIEATLLDYYENQKRDGHEYFFQDIRLQYWSPRPDETLSMKPESDPSAAMTVTRGTETSLSVGAELALSETPSANVSLGIDRTRTLTVEYALSTWSLSAHRVIARTTTTTSPETKSLSQLKKPERTTKAEERPVFQWFWAGTHRQTETLTPDLKYTVKRHVVAKRVIPIESFPRPKEDAAEEVEEGPPVDFYTSIDGLEAHLDNAPPSGEEEEGNAQPSETNPENDAKEGADDAGGASNHDANHEETGVAKEETSATKEAAGVAKNENKASGVTTLEDLLDFSFRVEVRVKKRFGRFHRLMLLSGNEVKGKLLSPSCEQGFRLRASPNWAGVPTSDTPDINKLLGKIKEEAEGRYDELTDLDFFELAGAAIELETMQEVEQEIEQEQEGYVMTSYGGF